MTVLPFVALALLGRPERDPLSRISPPLATLPPLRILIPHAHSARFDARPGVCLFTIASRFPTTEGQLEWRQFRGVYTTSLPPERTISTDAGDLTRSLIHSLKHDAPFSSRFMCMSPDSACRFSAIPLVFSADLKWSALRPCAPPLDKDAGTLATYSSDQNHRS